MTKTSVTLETQIPRDIYSALKTQGVHRDYLAAESKRLLALRFFREQKLSLGQAVRLSGMNYWSFIEFLSANDVAVVDLDNEELSNEFSTVKQIARQLRETQK